jgi:energy-coupling factor transporter ATP-binding protein EcfA2
MIVELFGPSGVGKTTLSHALASVLREYGYPVTLAASARPSERFGAGQPVSSLVRFRERFSRFAKMPGAIAALLQGSQETSFEAELMSMLITEPLLTRARNRRYLFSLRKLWADASSSECITIFDQGYLSAFCSVVCRNSALRRAMPNVLDHLPKPDVLICVYAHESVIRARLRARIGKLGPVERMLELDISTTLRQVAIATELTHQLALRRDIALIYCSGSRVPARVAQTIADQIEALPSAHRLLPKREGYGGLQTDQRVFHNLLFVIDQ